MLSMEVSDCSSVKQEVYSVRPPPPMENIWVQLKIEKKTGVLHSSLALLNGPRSIAEYGESLNGGVKTESCVYARGSRKGLLVMESKKKSNEKQPYMVSVGHYFVNSGGGGGGSGVDIGFSVMVKIGVGNGRLKKWFELGSGTLLHAFIARISNGSVDCYLRVKTATLLLRRRHVMEAHKTQQIWDASMGMLTVV